jgi:hypothetical protein
MGEDTEQKLVLGLGNGDGRKCAEPNENILT